MSAGWPHTVPAYVADGPGQDKKANGNHSIISMDTVSALKASQLPVREVDPACLQSQRQVLGTAGEGVGVDDGARMLVAGLDGDAAQLAGQQPQVQFSDPVARLSLHQIQTHQLAKVAEPLALQQQCFALRIIASPGMQHKFVRTAQLAADDLWTSPLRSGQPKPSCGTDLFQMTRLAKRRSPDIRLHMGGPRQH